MKLRIKFSKQGNVKFVGHLDVMRYFQKAIRRAGFSVAYSGMSQHMVMSFASPLGVGLLSNGEYVDIELTEPSQFSSKELCSRLNAAMAQGFEVKSVRELPDGAKNAMSIMAAVDYRVSFREGYEPPCWETFQKEFQAFCSRPSIPIVKKTKKNELELDIRPLIYGMHFDTETHSMFLQLSGSSADTLKPELVLGAFFQEKGETVSPFALEIEREEVYGFTDKEKTQFIPLEAFGHEFLGAESSGKEEA